MDGTVRAVLTDEQACAVALIADDLANNGEDADTIALLLVVAAGYGSGEMVRDVAVAILANVLCHMTRPWRGRGIMLALKTIPPQREPGPTLN